LEEKAAVALLAAGEQARALCRGVLDQFADRIRTAAVGEGPHPGVGFEAVADLHLGGTLGEAVENRLIDAALRIEAGRRDADLAGVPELLRDDHVESLLQ